MNTSKNTTKGKKDMEIENGIMRSILDAKHNQSKAQLKKMIEDMGFEDFINFYIIIHKINNRTTLTQSEAKEIVEESPKYVTTMISIVDLDFKRLGIDIERIYDYA